MEYSRIIQQYGCPKRQKGFGSSGQPIDTCIDKFSEQYLEIVNDYSCSGCPLSWPPCAFRRGTVCSVFDKKIDKDTCDKCNLENIRTTGGPMSQLKGYIKALKKWILAGRPTRTQAQVDQIMDDFCYKCPKYDKTNSSCEVCGCQVNTKGGPLGNKTRMATESCPLGHW